MDVTGFIATIYDRTRWDAIEHHGTSQDTSDDGRNPVFAGLNELAERAPPKAAPMPGRIAGLSLSDRVDVGGECSPLDLPDEATQTENLFGAVVPW